MKQYSYFWTATILDNASIKILNTSIQDCQYPSGRDDIYIYQTLFVFQ